MNIASFIISSIVIILLPGTGVVYTISTGISKGKKAAVFAALGCTAGIIPHLCLSIILSSLMLHLGDKVFNTVKIIGAIYLIFLGIQMILTKPNIKVEGTKDDLKPHVIIWYAVLINLLNPKLTIFFFSFLPQYAGTNSGSYLLQSFLFGIAFMLLTLVVFIGYGILSGSAKKFIEKSPKTTSILQKCFGAAFILFALQLALF